MTARGVEFVWIFEEIMDNIQYLLILDSYLPLMLDEFGLKEESAIFQHDIDSKHTFKITQIFLQK